jgi:tRNA modification GTPase
MKNKTIVALATPPMNGAIHIIRISGDNAFNLVNRICSNKITRKGYEIQKTNILDNNKIIDHVLINKFVAPKSFTGEDLVEINCHGGYYLASKIIELLIKYGCVLALPGEFTQRAYMNGKLLLHEAEAINNLINATSDRGIELANNGLNDGAINKLKKFRSDLFQLIAQVEINIDYPEFDDAPNMSIKKMNETIHSLINFATKVINDSTKIIPIIEGINIVIIGKPNVGKSSILNSIISKNRVIVSDTPGTTRDIITIPINLKGVTVNFLDTAGLRKTKNKIEQIGVNKTHEMMQKANLIL